MQESRDDNEIDIESAYLKELQAQKGELMAKVGSLKSELQDWRRRLDGQVQTYKGEVAKLRDELNSEVDALKSEFTELKAALRQQLELTTKLAQDAQIAAMPPSMDGQQLLK